MKTVRLLDDDERLVQVFKALGNPLRMKLIRYLAEHPQCITGDLVAASDMAQSTVSEHLKVLRDAGIVSGTVEGPARCYCLNGETLAWFREQVAFLTQELEVCCSPRANTVSAQEIADAHY